jgi:hypothetical protein
MGVRTGAARVAAGADIMLVVLVVAVVEVVEVVLLAVTGVDLGRR